MYFGDAVSISIVHIFESLSGFFVRSTIGLPAGLIAKTPLEIRNDGTIIQDIRRLGPGPLQTFRVLGNVQASASGSRVQGCKDCGKPCL